MTKNIDELKAEVNELKKAKIDELRAEAEQRNQDYEYERLTRELEALKSGRLPAPDISPLIEQATLKQAAVRQVICGFSHFFFGPAASIYYSVRCDNWAPFFFGTGAFVASIPLALVDFGFTAAIAPPVVSGALVITKSQEKRRQLGITMPEEADVMMTKFNKF